MMGRHFPQCDGATDHHAVHSAPAAVRPQPISLPLVDRLPLRSRQRAQPRGQGMLASARWLTRCPVSQRTLLFTSFNSTRLRVHPSGKCARATRAAARASLNTSSNIEIDVFEPSDVASRPGVQGAFWPDETVYCASVFGQVTTYPPSPPHFPVVSLYCSTQSDHDRLAGTGRYSVSVAQSTDGQKYG